MSNFKVITLFSILFLFSTICTFGQVVPDRRPAKANKDFGWMLAPVPISIAGVGSALIGWGSLSNIYEEADVSFAKSITGDFDMTIIYAQDIPIFSKEYTLSTGYYSNKVAFNSYKRGIDSEPDDYNVISTDQSGVFNKLTLRFWEGRVETFYQIVQTKSQTLAIYDEDLDKIPNSEGDEISNDQYNYGVIFDITDQRFDPRLGLRLGFRWDFPDISDETQADYSRYDYNITGYWSLFENDTLLFNYFKSQALVSRKGELDKDVIAAPYYCTPDVNCGDEIDLAVDDQYRANKYGTASPLGGPNRLRSYPLNRFQAGNSLYYALEYRYNFSEDAIPVNWYLLGGTQTSLQMALFAEFGSVHDDESKLTETIKSSYGFGFRALISGLVYRFDVAYGDEGWVPSIFIDYPMDINPIAG